MCQLAASDCIWAASKLMLRSWRMILKGHCHSSQLCVVKGMPYLAMNSNVAGFAACTEAGIAASRSISSFKSRSCLQGIMHIMPLKAR